jgi:hypothetical protein
MFWLPYYHHVALGFGVGEAGYMASGYEVRLLIEQTCNCGRMDSKYN